MDLIARLVPVLLLAAVVAFLMTRIGQVPLLGYLIAGAIVKLIAPQPGLQSEVVGFLGELGIILLLFYLGLELSWRQVAPVAGRSFALAVAALGLPFVLLHGIFLALGFTAASGLLLAFALSLTSTAIGVQVIEGRRELPGRLAALIIGVNLIVDVAAVVVLAVLSAGRGEGAPVGTLILRIAGFAAVGGTIGLLIIPRTLDLVHRQPASRMILPVLLISIGIGIALLGSRFGVPLSMGAFLAGSLASEARCREDLEAYLHPVKELFMAFFFIGVGFRIMPAAIGPLLPWAILISLVLVVARFLAVSLSAYLVGEENQLSIALAAALLPVSEFSFLVIAEAHLAAGTQGTLITLGCLTMFLTAFVARPGVSGAPQINEFIQRNAPAPLRTLIEVVRGSMAQAVSPFPPAGNPLKVAFRNMGVTSVALVGLAAAIAEGTSWLESIAPKWAGVHLVGTGLGVALLLPVVLIAVQRWRRLLNMLVGPYKTGPGAERIRLVQRATRGALNAVAVGLFLLALVPILYTLFAGHRLVLVVIVVVIGAGLAWTFRTDVARLHGLLEMGMTRGAGAGREGPENRGYREGKRTGSKNPDRAGAIRPGEPRQGTGTPDRGD